MIRVKTTPGRPAANQDLWKKMEAKLWELVLFWKIPRDCNEVDAYAKISKFTCLLSFVRCLFIY